MARKGTSSSFSARDIASYQTGHPTLQEVRTMDTRTTMIVLSIIVIAIVAIAVLLITRKRKSEHLKQQFGPEYDRAVLQHGDPRHAEAVLLEREKRVEKFSIRSLSPVDRERYANEWANVQKRFVDD